MYRNTTPTVVDLRIRWLEWAGSWMLTKGTVWMDTAWRLRERRGKAEDVELFALLREGWDKAMDRRDD
jgi:hypothetical protein